MGAARRDGVATAGFAALYAVAMYAGRETHVPPSQLALAWPAAGVVIVWFLACARSNGVLVAVGVVVVVSGLINQATGVEALGSWLFGLVNASTGVVGAWVLRRTGRWNGPRPVGSLADLGDIGVASVAGAAVSALSGGFVAWTRFGSDLWDGMLLIGFRNALSAFVVVVVLLAVPELRKRPGGLTVRAAAWAVGALVLSTVLMESSWPIGFTMVPPLLVIAMRCGYAVTAVVAGLQGVIVVAATMAGRGPFSVVAEVQQRVVLAQVLILVLTLVGFVVAVAERDRTLALVASRRDRDRLRDHMDAALVANAHLALSPAEGAVVVDANAALCSLTGRPLKELVGAVPEAWLEPESARALLEGVDDLVWGRDCTWRDRLEFEEAYGGATVDAALSVVPRGPESAEVELNLQMIDTPRRRRLSGGSRTWRCTTSSPASPTGHSGRTACAWHSPTPAGRVSSSASSTSTSTTSSSSTTPTATTWVTSCSARSPGGSRASCARTTPWRASVVTSSSCCARRCCPGRTGRGWRYGSSG